MALWTLFGLKHGKATTRWPGSGETEDGQDGLLGMPRYHPELCMEGCEACAEVCPTAKTVVRRCRSSDGPILPSRRATSVLVMAMAEWRSARAARAASRSCSASASGSVTVSWPRAASLRAVRAAAGAGLVTRTRKDQPQLSKKPAPALVRIACPAASPRSAALLAAPLVSISWN